jgi:alkylation response protein AidB-like acyl-CoA dehydrogenase
MAASTLMDEARAIAAEAAGRSLEIEAARVVPSEVIGALGKAGCLRMYVPRSLGGPEVDPLSAIEVIEALSAGDPSTGWTTFILNTTFFASWLDPTVAKELLDTPPEAGMAGTIGPIGRARRDGDGGFRLSGRWPFSSGSPHAGWFSEGGLVVDGDGNPRSLEDGRPDWRFFFVPAGDVEILDTWHVSGLRGTASHDVTISDAVVPAERTVNPIFGVAPHDAPHFRWPFFSLVSSLFTGVPLGVARRALDEFAVLATTKSRRSSAALAETESVAVAVAHTEGALRAARAFVVDAIGSAWEHALTGDRLRDEHRIAIRTASLHAMDTAVEVVDTVFALAGGGALYDTSPLQRCWRDIHAASHHLYFCNDDRAKTGRALLSGEAPDWIV